LEEFKTSFMSTMSHHLEHNFQITEPTPPAVVDHHLVPTQPNLLHLLPNINWTDYSHQNYLSSLKNLGKVIFIDLETTGLNVQKDRICQISLIMINHSDKDKALVETWEKIVYPGIPIPEPATKIHGITNDYTKYCRKLENYSDTITKYLTNATVVGFNSSQFDLHLLTNEFKRFNKNFRGFNLSGNLTTPHSSPQSSSRSQ
jgi:hypothetical protein